MSKDDEDDDDDPTGETHWRVRKPKPPKPCIPTAKEIVQGTPHLEFSDFGGHIWTIETTAKSVAFNCGTGREHPTNYELITTAYLYHAIESMGYQFPYMDEPGIPVVPHGRVYEDYRYYVEHGGQLQFRQWYINWLKETFDLGSLAAHNVANRGAIASATLRKVYHITYETIHTCLITECWDTTDKCFGIGTYCRTSKQFVVDSIVRMEFIEIEVRVILPLSLINQFAHEWEWHRPEEGEWGSSPPIEVEPTEPDDPTSTPLPGEPIWVHDTVLAWRYYYRTGGCASQGWRIRKVTTNDHPHYPDLLYDDVWTMFKLSSHYGYRLLKVERGGLSDCWNVNKLRVPGTSSYSWNKINCPYFLSPNECNIQAVSWKFTYEHHPDYPPISTGTI